MPYVLFGAAILGLAWLSAKAEEWAQTDPVSVRYWRLLGRKMGCVTLRGLGELDVKVGECNATGVWFELQEIGDVLFVSYEEIITFVEGSSSEESEELFI